MAGAETPMAAATLIPLADASTPKPCNVRQRGIDFEETFQVMDAQIVRRSEI
jgi:hypothetical protein